MGTVKQGVQEVAPIEHRFVQGCAIGSFLIVPPLIYGLRAVSAPLETWIGAMAVNLLAVGVLSFVAIYIADHDRTKAELPEHRDKTVGLWKRLIEPLYGASVRLRNVIMVAVGVIGGALAISPWISMQYPAFDLIDLSDLSLRSGGQELFLTTAGLVPLVLLILSTDQDLALARESWRQGWSLVAVAVLLGGLITAEVVSLGVISRSEESPASWATAVVILTLAASLSLVTWGIGWKIWNKYAGEVPQSGTAEKASFWWVGLFTLGAISWSAAWAVLQHTPR